MDSWENLFFGLLDQTFPFKSDRVIIYAVGLQLSNLTLYARSRDDIEEIGISWHASTWVLIQLLYQMSRPYSEEQMRASSKVI